MPTPDQIRREIKSIRGNIARKKKDLKNPQYSEQVKEDLRSDIRQAKNRIKELEEQLP